MDISAVLVMFRMLFSARLLQLYCAFHILKQELESVKKYLI